jgi:hypothetical protein
MSVVELGDRGARANEGKGAKDQHCEEVGTALDTGTLGKMVAKHEKLILRYYEDVQDQSKQSFELARRIAWIGFFVLIGSLGCAIILDVLFRFNMGVNVTDKSLGIGSIGLISGAIIEATAGGAFWLYSQTARQFGAFHICLERTHRYLLTYKIAAQLVSKKEETLRDLVCIMANAPMIGQATIEVPKLPQEATKPMQGGMQGASSVT